MFKWYRSIKEILREEPETWLNYLKSYQLNNMFHLLNNKPRSSGLALQLFKIPYQTILLIKPPFSNLNQKTEKCDFYVFAGTANQLSSVDSLVGSLRSKKQIVKATTFKTLLDNDFIKNDYTVFHLNYLDIFKSLIITISFAPRLYSQLTNLHPKANEYWFAEFCLVYNYLVYFERVLNNTSPEFVITANDHSIQNRCLLAVAHKLNIKTVYIQHASVSPLFPALRVDYAFLDGQSALEIYKQCESNLPISSNHLPIPKIFLSGQKKKIIKSRLKETMEIKKVGIAFNSLDVIDDIIILIKSLIDKNIKLIVRWHPAQNKQDIIKITAYIKNLKGVFISDPKHESVGDFLAKINLLIAGNSSIHLEAALANVLPIYFEVSKANKPDYYGYVKSGLAINAKNITEIRKILDLDSYKLKSKIQEASIRYYSSTYKTEWEGKEGELVAECLIALKNNIATPIKPVTLEA